jgi:hypothetical protein
MATKFEPKNTPIVLKGTAKIEGKIAFVQNLYDKAHDKINHFDRLRQQLLNYAIIVFSGLLAFIMNTDSALMQVAGCMGIVIVMLVFRHLDHRYHTSTHGFGASMIIFTQVMAYLLNHPNHDVNFLQYHTPGEDTTQKWSLQARIYVILAASAGALGLIIAIMAIIKTWVKI